MPVSLECHTNSSCWTETNLCVDSLSSSPRSVLVSLRARLMGISGRGGESASRGDLRASDSSSSWGKNIFTEELACPIGLNPADLEKPKRALAGLPTS